MGFWGALGSIFGIVRTGISSAVWKQALAVVGEAAVHWLDNDKRREWAVTELMKRAHLPENVARFVVELAVKHTKQAA